MPATKAHLSQLPDLSTRSLHRPMAGMDDRVTGAHVRRSRGIRRRRPWPAA